MATLSTLASFNGSDGGYPAAGLIADAKGDLFGTTSSGGAYGSGFGDGTVFEIAKTSTRYAAPKTLVSFDCSDGRNPYPSLIADANGDLFGTTLMGGAYEDYGTVFEIAKTSTGYASAPATLVTFNNTDGSYLRGSLIADANGDLFGTTSSGGTDDNGTVFEIQNTGTVAAPVYASAPTTLVSFNFSPSYGGGPNAGLNADANGDLFGTTCDGGADGDGTAFEIKNTGTAAAPIYAGAPTTLVSFGGSNGEYPHAGLIVDANDDLFGTINGSGAAGDGTVFEIQNTGTVAAPVYASAPTTLVSFNGSDGADPEASLIADANGDLFGTTSNGLAGCDGTVFEIKNAGTVAAPNYASAPITLASFSGYGAGPAGSIIADANGDLFGTTSQGGANARGTVFEITGAGFVTAPPTISGTIGGQTTIAEAPVTPFAEVTVGDPNASATDTLTITLSKGGANGKLSGTNLSGLKNGLYTLTGTAAAITTELDALTFTPATGAPNSVTTSTFTLSDKSSAYATAAVNSATTVTDTDAAVAPTITGTHATPTKAGAPVNLFSTVRVGDSNASATDTLTITLSNGGANGKLSGTGLSGGTNGVYTLTGTAAAITTHLDVLKFTPATGAPGSVTTTTFTLSDRSSAFATQGNRVKKLSTWGF
jgi:uncharacterized repeat protein (TIGR03803 family)